MNNHNPMNNKIKLRGNVCTCSGIWFNLDIPESDPDRCPYCGRSCKIDVSPDDELDEFIHDEKILNESTKKALDSDVYDLVSNICTFCANEIYVHKDDAHAVHLCPYCDGDLIPEVEFQNIVQKFVNEFEKSKPQDRTDQDSYADAKTFGLDINDLTGKMVRIKFKQILPCKASTYILLGVDPISCMIRVNRILDNKTIWKSIADIKYIIEIED